MVPIRILFFSYYLEFKGSNVLHHHDLSELLLESSLDDIIEGNDGAEMDEASIHNTYSAHSWADRVEEREFIPQAALDLKAEYGGFLEDPSFSMESLHGGDVQEYGRSNTQEALGCDKGSFQGRKKGESADDTTLVCLAICHNNGLPNKAIHGENLLDKASNQGCDGRSSQGLKEGGKLDGATPLIPASCGINELSIKPRMEKAYWIKVETKKMIRGLPKA
ncbi:hypothetical protein F0562_010386 [Nyssa sinensis]|uniref:Uncharacterized protein n=1 Tax=Nyssa sinensis TaxID=561372 RepID=A0A5J4ZZF5_9ASTE|nr:hypothetical protein F0562_010386 [Nyssa sinensis]